jgi:hypothetical protein
MKNEQNNEKSVKIDQQNHQKVKVIKVTKEYFETEDEKVWFDEPLEKEISVEEMQKIVDRNQRLIKELR